MYTSPHNICLTLKNLFERNEEEITKTIRIYEDRNLNFFEGVRKSLPADAYPCFEIEPSGADGSWTYTRAQTVQFNFKCTLTLMNSNMDMGVEYQSALTTILIHIMTDPTSLQMPIVMESKFDPNDGLVTAYMLDSFVEGLSYDSIRSGTVWISEWSWWVKVVEPFPDSKWMGGNQAQQIIAPVKTITF